MVFTPQKRAANRAEMATKENNLHGHASSRRVINPHTIQTPSTRRAGVTPARSGKIEPKVVLQIQERQANALNRSFALVVACYHDRQLRRGCQRFWQRPWSGPARILTGRGMRGGAAADIPKSIGHAPSLARRGWHNCHYPMLPQTKKPRGCPLGFRLRFNPSRAGSAAFVVPLNARPR